MSAHPRRIFWPPKSVRLKRTAFPSFNAASTKVSAIDHGDGLDFNEPLGANQSFHNNEGADRRGHGVDKTISHFQNMWNEGRIDTLHAEIVELHNIAEIAASRFDRGLNVAEDLLGLSKEVILPYQQSGFVERDLSRDVNEFPSSDFRHLRVSRRRNEHRFRIEQDRLMRIGHKSVSSEFSESKSENILGGSKPILSID